MTHLEMRKKICLVQQNCNVGDKGQFKKCCYFCVIIEMLLASVINLKLNIKFFYNFGKQ